VNGVFNNNATTASNVDCLVLMQGSQANLVSLTVNVTDNSTSQHTEARACTHPASNTSFSCGTVAMTTGPGVGDVPLPVGITAWTTNLTDFPIVTVNLGLANAGPTTAQHFWGYTVSGT